MRNAFSEADTVGAGETHPKKEKRPPRQPFSSFCLLSFLACARENIFQRVDDFADGAVVAAKRLNQAEDLINQCFDEIHTIVPPSKEYAYSSSPLLPLYSSGVSSAVTVTVTYDESSL